MMLNRNRFAACMPASSRQRGASAVEFVIAAPVLLIMGLGTLQAGMLYHNKSILNYATFEAARVGATRHAQPEPMMKELGVRLAPLYGGDGTMEMAAQAMARSIVETESPVNMDGSVAPATRIRILNPTIESFDKWGVPSLEFLDRTAIPNSHLKHQNDTEGEDTEAMTLAEANLLKIEVTHGVELKIPFINAMITTALAEIEAMGGGDPEKLAYYQAGRIPISSTATVRMQSEAWKESIELANAAPPVPGEPDNTPALGVVPDNGEGDPPFSPLPDGQQQCNEYGFVESLVEPQQSALSCETNVGSDTGSGDGQSCVNG